MALPAWLSDNPEAALKQLRGRASDRKLRLLAVAACRHVYPATKLTAARLATLAVVERFADGEAGLDELTREQGAALARLTLAADDVGWNSRVYEEGIWGPAQTSAFGAAWTAVRQSVSAAGNAACESLTSFSPSAAWEMYGQAEATARSVLLWLLGDIFPSRTFPFPPAWRTPDVLRLAADIYRARAFETLPYLGDALEEAGCANLFVLRHLRGGGAHVLGCWALDLALGRE